MKLNFTIDINDTEYLQDEIISHVSDRILEEIMGYGWEKSEFTDVVKNKILKMMEDTLTTDFKKEVSEKVTEALTTKFEKTKQYKELAKGVEIENDKLIKTGLKDLVAEIVKSEMKKIFNNWK